MTFALFARQSCLSLLALYGRVVFTQGG